METVELHGGPRHGQTYELPFPDSRSIEFDVLFNVDGRSLYRRGKYTRVRTISDHPTSDFEWSGFITVFMPVEEKRIES